MQVENSIPNFRERGLEAGIPGNDREREFPLTPDWYPLKRMDLYSDVDFPRLFSSTLSWEP